MIPLMIKMPDQSVEIRLDEGLDTVLTQNMLPGILQRELGMPQDVVPWMRPG